MDWDIFICHSSEDKESFVRPLAEALRDADLKVWYDDFSLSLGDSLHRSIDHGLAKSRFGVVVLSPSFFEKHWPRVELDGLAQREVGGDKVILPIWHNISRGDVMKYSPTLADKLAIESRRGIEIVVGEILRAVRGGRAETPHPPVYKHRVPVNYQGQLSIRVGNDLEIKSWFGPDGAGGSGQLRVSEMTDLTEQTEYTSDIARAMMTIYPTSEVIRGRVAGPIQRAGSSVNFSLDMTDAEFAKFDANRNVRRNPLLG